MDAPSEPPDGTKATRIDGRGRVVIVSIASLYHIQLRHPEVRADDILVAIERAHQRTRGRSVGVEARETLWAEDVGRKPLVGRRSSVRRPHGTRIDGIRNEPRTEAIRPSMSVRIGAWEFDEVAYDRDTDVLYLSLGPPGPGVGEETPEGHIVRYDDAARVVGITIVGARSLVEAGEPVYVTFSQRSEISARELAPALDG